MVARLRRVRRVFSANGQPQCLRNVIIVDFPLGFGNESLDDEGALEFISGGDWTSVGD